MKVGALDRFFPVASIFFTVFAVLEFFNDVATLLKSHMNGWIPFTGAIKQKTETIPQTLTQ